MLIGHYGVALGAKRFAPRTSLGALAFAAQWLDELWPILLLAGVEHVRVVPGLMAASPLDFVSYPISHSLAAAIGWALLIGGIYWSVRHDARGAIVMGLLVASHWILDVPMHRPDLPLWPGSPVRVGLGAWRSIPLTIILDAGVFVAGFALYLHDTRARDAIGKWALWILALVLIGIFAAGFTSTPPSDQRTIGLTTLGLWLVVPWCWWIDRHRYIAPPVAMRLGLTRT